MNFRRSRAVVPVLEVLPEAASTNDVLQARAGDLPDLAVVVTDNQTGGDVHTYYVVAVDQSYVESRPIGSGVTK